MKSLVFAREEVSKWMMRFNQGGRQLKLVFWGVTAASTAGTFLQGTALQPYIPAFLLAGGLGTIGFVYAYDRFQVLNIQNKWNADRSNNFVGPSHAIRHNIEAQQLAVLSKSIAEDWDFERTQEELTRVTNDAIEQYRDGIEIEDFSGGYQ